MIAVRHGYGRLASARASGDAEIRELAKDDAETAKGMKEDFS